jgi:histidinol-phosphate aminotransferase
MNGPEEIIRDEIRALAAYHVPPAEGMVKLDAMENPYALPQAVRERIGQLVARAEINRYPDAGAASLKSTLQRALGIPAGVELLLGNGSDEIIQMLMLAVARPGATVLGVEPAFVMFKLIASFCGLRFAGVPLRADFSLDAERTVAAIEEHQPALVFIAYPNNPTGNLFDDAAIDKVIASAPGLVVIDEAYHAFAERTYMQKLGENPNLLVMRTLSKSGFAGLRLGLLAGAATWLKEIDKVRLPYNVGVLTQLVAEEALQHQELLHEQASAIKAERARLYAALEREARTTPFPTNANFILFKTPAAQAAFDGLKRRGVLIKNLHGSHPALDGCLRVTVGTADENDRFLAALSEALA